MRHSTWIVVGLAGCGTVSGVPGDAPTVTGASFSPSAPTVEDTLSVVSVAVNDPNGDDTTLAYAWTIDGVDAGSAETLDLGAARRGAEVAVTLTANDGKSDGTPLRISVTLANATPRLEGIRLEPATPVTDDAIVAHVTAVDADEDVLLWKYAWMVAGRVVQTGASDTYVGTRGEVVSVRVVADDGIARSEPEVSAEVTVGNAPPRTSGVTVAYADAVLHAGTGITCPVGEVVDPEGDAYVVSPPTWLLDGVPVTPAGGAGNGLKVPQGWRGHALTCTRTLEDELGAGTGPLESAVVPVVNAPPEWTKSLALPGVVYVGDVVRLSSTGALDRDDDQVDVAFAWSVGGLTLGDEVAFFVPSQRGASVLCEVTLDDGFESVVLTTTAAFIGNHAPVLSSVAIIPWPVDRSQAPYVQWYAPDADGDVLTATIVWDIDGVEVQRGSDPELGVSYLPGQLLGVTVTVDDGYGGVSSMRTTSGVVNVAPSVALQFDPKHPRDDEDIVCVPEITDVDDAAMASVRYTWTRNGVSWTGAVATTHAPGDTIAAATAAVGETWACTVAVVDPYGATASSNKSTAQRGPLHVAAAEVVTLNGGDRYYTDVLIEGRLRVLGNVRIFADTVEVPGWIDGRGLASYSNRCPGSVSLSQPAVSVSGSGGCGGGRGGGGLPADRSNGGYAPPAPGGAGLAGGGGADGWVRNTSYLGDYERSGHGGLAGAGLSIYADSVSIDGLVDLSGTPGESGVTSGGGVIIIGRPGGGGGAGGLFLEACVSLHGSGDVVADGGTSSEAQDYGGGGGGGGSLFVRTPGAPPALSFTVSVEGGAAATTGTDGWVWTETAPCTAWQ